MNLIAAPSDISSKDLPLRDDVRLLTRTPYIDPLNHLQVALLERHRAGDKNELVKRAIHLTINGIATGLRNSG